MKDTAISSTGLVPTSGDPLREVDKKVSKKSMLPEGLQISKDTPPLKTDILNARNHIA